VQSQLDHGCEASDFDDCQLLQSRCCLRTSSAAGKMANRTYFESLSMSPSMFRWIVVLEILATVNAGIASEPVVYELNSSRQASVTTIRILFPDVVPKEDEPRLRVIYVLPVEAGHGTRWGDALAEIQKLDLHNKHHVACVFPTFSDLPWYADHPENPQLQQEAYLLQDVLPLVEKNHPVRNEREGRLLVGFSKSGWGSWSLLLRHPKVFHRAAAFDAPMMMDAPGKYGSGPIFGSVENFRQYQISSLVQQRAHELKNEPSRLLLIGQGNFQMEHVQIKNKMDALQVPHTWIEGNPREHSWNSGWIAEAIGWLTQAER
jgi:hypothetical protein